MIEFPLPDGRYGYLQYVKEHRDPPRYGSFVRVLGTPSPEKLTAFAVLTQTPEKFLAFVPLGTICKRGYARIVDRLPVPDHLREWPLFKTFNENIKTEQRTWWLSDLDREWRVGKLAAKHHDLPLRETLNLTALEERIMSGWRHRDEAR